MELTDDEEEEILEICYAASSSIINGSTTNNNGIIIERYTEAEISKLVERTKKSKKKADTCWKRTGIEKRLKHAAQRIGAKKTLYQSSYHFAKAVQKVKEIAVNDVIRTDNTLDINQFLLEYDTTIIKTFDRYFFVKKGNSPAGKELSENDVREVLKKLGKDIEWNEIPDHVVATLYVLADFARNLHNEVRKKCKKTALTKAREHWNDRLPLVFTGAGLILALSLYNQFNRNSSGFINNFSEINYITISVIGVAFLCSVIFIILRVYQSLDAEALNCAETFYDNFKKKIPIILTERVNHKNIDDGFEIGISIV